MRAAVEAQRRRTRAPAASAMMLLRARRDDAVAGDVVDAGRCATRAGGGRQPMQLRERRDDRLAERLDEPAGDGRGRLHRDLLAEDRAQPHLEAVERAGHAQAGIGLDRRGQARVPAQMPGDQIGPRVEIEQRAHAGRAAPAAPASGCA